MIKTDKSIYGICIAAIKRHTMQPFDFKWTNFYEDNHDFTNRYAHMPLVLEEGEHVICSTIIDADNWSILTTRRLFTNLSGELKAGYMDNAKILSFGKFNSAKEDKTLGELQFSDKNRVSFHIETRRASMIMIYGVRTRIGMQVGKP